MLASIIGPRIEPSAPNLVLFLLLIAVLCSALYGGTRHALVTLVFAGVAADYAAFPPHFAFALETAPLLSVCEFLVIGGVMIAALARRNQQLLEQRRALEQETASSRLRAFALEAAANAIIITDRRGSIQWVNSAFTQLTGYSAEEVMGQNPRLLKSGQHDPTLYADLWQTVLAGQVWRGELVNRRKDGSLYTEEMTITPVPGADGTCSHFIAIKQDVTARKQAETEIRRLMATVEEEKDRLSALIKAMTDEVWFADTNGRITLANPAAVEAFRITEAVDVRQLVANTAVARPDGTPRPLDEAPPLRALSGEVIKDVEEIVCLPGSAGRRYREVSSSPVRNATGEIIGSVSVVRDITQRKRAEKALREASRRKDEFLAMLGHELRNPLAPIRNAVHLLRRTGPPDPKVAQARDLIDRQVTHLTRLVDDLLDISRISRGTITLRKERVDLAAIVEQAVETARPSIAPKGHVLTVTCAPQPITVEADPARMVQVISNLLNNAAKFTEPGGRISLITEQEDGYARIRIRDTGRGIAPDQLQSIFDIFVQGEATLARTEGGLGIGLALARHLVEQHGGRIEAHSAGRGEGSEFVVTWPAVATLPLPRAAHPPLQSAGPERGLRLMVVEDNVEVAESFIELLRLQGHEVHAAQTGRRALELAETFVPDVAFVDIGIPEPDGYEVARRLRAMPKFHDTLLVAVTGYVGEDDRRRATQAGFDHHMAKPADPNAIELLLRNVSLKTTSSGVH